MSFSSSSNNALTIDEFICFIERTKFLEISKENRTDWTLLLFRIDWKQKKAEILFEIFYGPFNIWFDSSRSLLICKFILSEWKRFHDESFSDWNNYFITKSIEIFPLKKKWKELFKRKWKLRLDHFFVIIFEWKQFSHEDTTKSASMKLGRIERAPNGCCVVAARFVSNLGARSLRITTRFHRAPKVIFRSKKFARSTLV